jgi:hypothetical protein
LFLFFLFFLRSFLVSIVDCVLFVHSWFCFSLVFLRSCLVPNVDCVSRLFILDFDFL